MISLQTFSYFSHFILYHLCWPDKLYLSSFSLKNVAPYDHYAACCVPFIGYPWFPTLGIVSSKHFINQFKLFFPDIDSLKVS